MKIPAKNDHPPIIESGRIERVKVVHCDDSISYFWQFKSRDKDDFYAIALSEDNNDERLIVASYWRSAWTDEGVRISLSKRAVLSSDEASVCFNNAEAWRIWSENGKS